MWWMYTNICAPPFSPSVSCFFKSRCCFVCAWKLVFIHGFVDVFFRPTTWLPAFFVAQSYPCWNVFYVSRCARVLSRSFFLPNQDEAHLVFSTLNSSGLPCMDQTAAFEVLVVDEAAQSVEVSTIIPLRREGERQKRLFVSTACRERQKTGR